MTQLSGAEKIQAFREAGFSEAEIDEWRAKREAEYLGAGFSQPEINAYFGEREFNKQPVEEMFKQNLKNMPAPPVKQNEEIKSESFQPGNSAAGFVQETQEPQKYVDSLSDAIQYGFQISLPGLGIRHKLPDKILPEDASSFYQIASMLSTAVADQASLVPTFGAIEGAAIGTAMLGPGIGTAAGFGGGAFGLTEAFRSTLIDAYKNGGINSFKDFWERSSAIFLDTLKSTAVGAFSFGTGAQVGKIIGAGASPTVLKKGTVVASEIAAMVGLGNALEGKVPEPRDFAEAAIVIGALHAGVGGIKLGAKLTKESTERVAEKLRNIYTKSGNLPHEVVDLAESNPGVQEDLLSTNIEFPRIMEINPPPSQVKIPKELMKLGEGFTDEPTPHMRADQFQVPEKVERAPRDLSPAEERIRARIAPYEKEIDNRTWKEVLDTAYAESVDATHYLKRWTEALSADPVETIKNPHQLARLYAGNSGRAYHFLEFGTFNPITLEINGKSLKQVFEPVNEELDRFSYYLLAKRTEELHPRGIDTGITLEDAKQVIQEGAHKYESVAQEYYDFNNRGIDYLVESEVITEKLGAKIKQLNKAYVPLNRLMDEPTKKGEGRGLIARNPLKKIEGSKRLILDPIPTTIQNLFTTIAMGERNLIFKAMNELADKSELGEEYLKRQGVDKEIKPKPTTEQLELLKEYGVEDEKDVEAFSPFIPDRGLGKNEISGFIKGQRRVYEVSPDVARLMQGLDAQTANLALKFAGAFSQTLRFGHTMTPEFFLRSFTADQFDAYIKSENGYKFLITSLEGVGHIFKKSDEYKAWLRAGGGGAEFHTLYKDYIKSSITDLEKTGMFNNMRNIVKYPFEMIRVGEELGELAKRSGAYVMKPLRALGEYGEQGIRVGDFALGIEYDKSPANLKAKAFGSRELIVDYKRQGLNATIKGYSLITTFWNASLQSIDRTFRLLGDKRLLKIGQLGLGSISAISALLWFANHNRKKWKDGLM